jgi:polysaccharide export outer membrane protein
MLSLTLRLGERGFFSKVSKGDMIMRNFLFVRRFFLVLFLLFLVPQICSGAEKTSWSKWVSVESYKIGSGDVLEIITWKEPDFSREEVLVRIDGKITFPLLGDIQASDRTPVQIKKDIEKGLKDFVDSPIVTVTVKNPGSQKFYILGEVQKTGEYVLIKNLTVLQAFALAGGFTDWASKKEIILFRKEDGKDKIIRINYKNIVQGRDFKQNIQLKTDDIIIVP